MNRAKIKNMLIVFERLLDEAAHEHMELFTYEINELQSIRDDIKNNILKSFDSHNKVIKEKNERLQREKIRSIL